MAKIILTHEVLGLGAAGDVVEVKNGYARNYLVPQGFAVPWTRGGQAQVDQIRRAREARMIASVEHAEELKKKLEADKIRVVVRTGQGGRLFGSVKPATVAAAIEAAGLGEVDKRKITVPKIKTTGTYPVIVHLMEGIDANAQIQVIAEK